MVSPVRRVSTRASIGVRRTSWTASKYCTLTGVVDPTWKKAVPRIESSTKPRVSRTPLALNSKPTPSARVPAKREFPMVGRPLIFPAAVTVMYSELTPVPPSNTRKDGPPKLILPASVSISPAKVSDAGVTANASVMLLVAVAAPRVMSSKAETEMALPANSPPVAATEPLETKRISLSARTSPEVTMPSAASTTTLLVESTPVKFALPSAKTNTLPSAVSVPDELTLLPSTVRGPNMPPKSGTKELAPSPELTSASEISPRLPLISSPEKM